MFPSLLIECKKRGIKNIMELPYQGQIQMISNYAQGFCNYKWPKLL